MGSFLFISVFIVVPLFCSVLLKLTRIKLSKPTIPSIFLMFYLINAYIGILPLFFYWDKYRYFIGVSDKRIILKMLIFTSLSLVAIIIGFIACSQLFKMKFGHNYVEILELSSKKTNKIIILFLVSLGVLFLYLTKIPSIPLLASIRGQSFSELLVLRSASGNSFQGKYHWYNLFMRQILLYLSYITFSQSLITKKWKDQRWFIATFIASAFSCLMLNEKAPIFYYIFGLFLTYLITTKRKINFKSLSKIGLFGMSAMSIMYMFFMNMRNRPILDVLKAILSRLFTGSISPAYFYIKIFPEKIDFLLGRSLPNPRGLFPWEHYKLTVEVMNTIFPYLEQMEVTGTAPTVFWGEAYTNFGVPGILFFSILVGMVLYTLQYILNRNRIVNPVIIGLQVWLMLELQNLTFSGISMIFGVSIPVMILISLLLIGGKQSRHVSSNNLDSSGVKQLYYDP